MIEQKQQQQMKNSTKRQIQMRNIPIFSHIVLHVL